MRFPEFSGEWVTKSINDLAVVIGGGTPDTTVKSYWDGEIQWFTPSEIGKNKYVDSSLRTITEVGLNNSSAKLLPPNTILLSSRATIGECSLSLRECATNQGFQCLVSKKCNVDFLYYLIQTKKKDLIRKSCGSTFLEISANEVRKIQVSVPSDVEQQKIAELLSLIDERIATQNKIIEKLQSLIKGLIDDIITLKCGQLVAFETLYSKAGEGGTPTTSNTEFYDNGSIPFIKIDDLSNKYLSANKDYITELGLKKSSAWLIPTHSIIYSNGATIGAISINKYPVCTKQGILGIVPNTNIDVEFLYYFMQSSYFQKEVERVVTEGTMKTAYLKDINHIKCPIPDLDRQKEISHLLSVLSLKEDVERQLLQKYQIQKQYLLRKMFI
ncbi:restriction endonuclease subunit S [Bacteroides uniformis]|uniref:Restriction endonuclease subunit S n=1 Tax=Bacteroides uniformis TaxID=820 RepID=A0A374N7I2_BACUN|nr:restriction endonuclease subunit S [Bacteroides uniformis]RGI79689.1 restriction endonuclease subunit S [Bacteroides uniformis]